jgi:hypothetical protein
MNRVREPRRKEANERLTSFFSRLITQLSQGVEELWKRVEAKIKETDSDLP